jgi:hypothetical protein
MAQSRHTHTPPKNVSQVLNWFALISKTPPDPLLKYLKTGIPGFLNKALYRHVLLTIDPQYIRL